MDAPPLDSILDQAATPRAATVQQRASAPVESARFDAPAELLPVAAAPGGGYWVTAFGYAKLELLPAVLVRHSSSPTLQAATHCKQPQTERMPPMPATVCVVTKAFACLAHVRMS